MSIRLRLTLLYSVILAVTLVASGVALYAAVSGITVSAAQDALGSEIRSYALATQLHNDPDRPGILQLRLPPHALTYQDYVEVRLLDGTSIYRSDNLKALQYHLPLDAVTRQGLRLGAVAQSSASIGGHRLLLDVTALPVHIDQQPGGPPGAGPPASAQPQAVAGTLQIATSLQGVDQTLATLRNSLLLGGILVLLLACGAGWLLAGTVLRPINRITQAAREIGTAQDFNRRVAYAGPPDEIGRLASTFNTMLERLRAAYQTQRRFVGDASHELRTPLTTIRGNLGLLQLTPPIAEHDRVAVVADLVSETERLMRLVNDLLALARSDAGRTLRPEAVTLRPLVSRLLRRLAAAHPGRTIQEDDGAEVAVVADADALTQVLLILLDNALKFTPLDGTVAIAVEARGNQVAMTVRDTGTGIAPEVIPHIFERFYQGDEARTGTGTGLGLAIAKALVEAQHGTLSVESQLGRGSTFTVALPRAEVAQSPVLVRAGSG